MAKLIEVAPTIEGLPSYLRVNAGDLIRFSATGGWVRSGVAITLLGVFTEGVIGTDGQVLTPAGPPNAVVFQAREPGLAEVEVVTGEPGRSQEPRTLAITVEA